MWTYTWIQARDLEVSRLTQKLADQRDQIDALSVELAQANRQLDGRQRTTDEDEDLFAFQQERSSDFGARKAVADVQTVAASSSSRSVDASYVRALEGQLRHLEAQYAAVCANTATVPATAATARGARSGSDEKRVSFSFPDDSSDETVQSIPGGPLRGSASSKTLTSPRGRGAKSGAVASSPAKSASTRTPPVVSSVVTASPLLTNPDSDLALMRTRLGHLAEELRQARAEREVAQRQLRDSHAIQGELTAQISTLKASVADTQARLLSATEARFANVTDDTDGPRSTGVSPPRSGRVRSSTAMVGNGAVASAASRGAPSELARLQALVRHQSAREEQLLKKLAQVCRSGVFFLSSCGFFGLVTCLY
jgi:predicted  nucleic acid-binding Zn-ribbon protein